MNFFGLRICWAATKVQRRVGCVVLAKTTVGRMRRWFCKTELVGKQRLETRRYRCQRPSQSTLCGTRLHRRRATTERRRRSVRRWYRSMLEGSSTKYVRLRKTSHLSPGSERPFQMARRATLSFRVRYGRTGAPAAAAPWRDRYGGWGCRNAGS